MNKCAISRLILKNEQLLVDLKSLLKTVSYTLWTSVSSSSRLDPTLWPSHWDSDLHAVFPFCSQLYASPRSPGAAERYNGIRGRQHGVRELGWALRGPQKPLVSSRSAHCQPVPLRPRVRLHALPDPHADEPGPLRPARADQPHPAIRDGAKTQHIHGEHIVLFPSRLEAFFWVFSGFHSLWVNM